MGADDWEREQETIHVLQSRNLMQQIADSLETHTRGEGYRWLPRRGCSERSQIKRPQSCAVVRVHTDFLF